MITYGSAAGTIDLGSDPPLVIGKQDEDKDSVPAHRSVSWRWMGGTVLTGVTSILLMGTALFAALSNPDQFVSLPDTMVAFNTEGDGIVFGRKSDRIRPQEQHVADRQILQVSTITRQGERDFIKLKPFARITASLTPRGDEYAAQVPEYDALRIFADTAAPEVPTEAPDVTVASGNELYGSVVDGEVAVKVGAFPISGADLEPTAVMDSAEVEQIVRTAAALPSLDGVDPLLGYADSGGDVAGDPFSALGVSITAENVSSIAKSDAGSTLDEGYQEKIISVAEDQNIRALFEKSGIAGDEADEIIAALSQLVDVSRMRPGQKIRVAYAVDPALAAATALADPEADPGSELPRRPIRVSVYDNGAHQATVARADNNAFVRADEPSAMPAMFAEAAPEEAPSADGPVRIYDALYQTALEQQIPPEMIDQLIRVFAFDVDFQARVAPGDAMEVFHSLPDPTDAEASDPEVLYASLTLSGVSKRFYRFRSSDDGIVDYYDAQGSSAKKFLIRKPVVGGRISSNFGYRNHPILGRTIQHTGVDYGGVGSGAPIFAAGNGVIEKAGRSSGYGNLIVVQHTNGYETYYAHQSRFAKGIKPGVRVRQGQIIGYVGSTGQSTGPHLHFEIRINGKPVDPLRIRLPQGRVLEGDYLASFEHERQRIDTLLGLEQAPGATPQTVASVAADTATQ